MKKRAELKTKMGVFIKLFLPVPADGQWQIEKG